MLFHPGYGVLPPLVAYRADRMDDATYDATANALRTRIRTLFDTAPIPFRHQNGGSYAIPSMVLSAAVGEPGVTGFAAHLRGSMPDRA